MPARIARSSAPQHFKEKSNKNRQAKSRRDRNLDAFAIAQEENPDRLKYRKHRYGEAEGEDQSQSRKRQRDSDDDEDEAGGLDSGDEDRGHPKSKRPRVYDGLDAQDGSDSSGNEWHYGFDAEAGDEDEDIDSDEAFGDSDGERFEDYTFRGSSSNKSKPMKSRRHQNSEGSDQEPDDAQDSDGSLGSDAVDLATMLDNPQESDDEDEPAPAKKTSHKTGQSLSTLNSLPGNSSDDDASQQDSMSSFSDDDDADDESADDDGADFTRLAKLRSMVSEMEKAEQEGSDDEDYSTTLKPGALLAAMQQVASGNKKPSLQEKRRRAKDAPLTAPLPKRQQDKLNREAAYSKAKETLGRWQETVKHNREADHLTFPLVDPTAQEAVGTSRMLPTPASKPQNDLEFAIQGILEQSGLSNTKKKDQPETEGDELPDNKPSLKEVQARRAELRRARELLFREEQRSKRIKKIKSKAYRRVHRKERERNAVSERELLQGINDSDDEDAKERHDRRRAEERMSTRHKDSRWAKNAKKTGQLTWNDSARAGVEDMARRDEELRRRIQGEQVGSGAESSEDDNEDDSDDDEAFRLRATAKLDDLEDESDDGGKAGRIANLGFMKRADADRKKANDEAVAELRRELNAGDDDEHSESEEEQIPMGRRVFGAPKPDHVPAKKASRKARKNELEEGDLSEDDEQPAADLLPGSIEQQQPPRIFSKTTTRPLPKLQSKPTKSALTSTTPPASKGTNPSAVPASKAVVIASHTPLQPRDEDSASEDEGEAEALQALSNRDLIASAFGADETTSAAFAREKTALAASEAPVESTPTSLLGWGSWAGSGISQKPRRVLSKSQNAKAEKNSSEKRKDAAKKDVILSERKSRKQNKLRAGMLPFPYESAAQYERSLRVPLGKEWNAKRTVEENVRPRVLLKGGIVQPMERPV